MSLSDKQKQQVFSSVVRILQSLEKTHGKETVKWAVNKYMTARREKEKLLKRKADLEKELATLDKVI